LHPKRDMLFYRLFFILAVSLYISLKFLFTRGPAKNFQAKLPWYAGVSVASGLMMAMGFVNNIIAPDIWPKEFIVGLVVVIFCLKPLMIVGPVKEKLEKSARRFLSSRTIIVDGVLLALILSVVWVTHPSYIAAYSFLFDANLHCDTFVFAPALVHYLGGIINMDVFSFYGVSLPVILAFLARLCGHLSYELWMCLYLALMYAFFAMLFVFYRVLLRSRFWALGWTMVTIFAQMFHPSLAPVPLNFPSATVLRYFYFIFVAVALLYHEYRGGQALLWIAGLLTGIALTHFWDTGIYQLIAFYVFLILKYYREYSKDANGAYIQLRNFAMLAALPLVSAFGILWGVSKGQFLQAQYWQNSLEQLWMTLHGWLNNPLTDQIQQGQVVYFLGALIFPCFYALCLGHALLACWQRKASGEILVMVYICVFGALLYHYFILHSVGGAYMNLSVPAFMLAAWLFRPWLESRSKEQRGHLAWVAAVGIIMLFIFNQSFVRYPNIYSLRGQEWEALRQRYVQEGDFKKDADMIRSLVAPAQKAAVVSSYDVRFCLQSGRQPFFYYVPIFRGAWLNSEDFKGTLIYTPQMMERILRPLQDAPPEYIFVEKKILYGRLRPEVYGYSNSLMEILRSVVAKYNFYREGEYLVCLIKKH